MASIGAIISSNILSFDNKQYKIGIYHRDRYTYMVLLQNNDILTSTYMFDICGKNNTLNRQRDDKILNTIKHHWIPKYNIIAENITIHMEYILANVNLEIEMIKEKYKTVSSFAHTNVRYLAFNNSHFLGNKSELLFISDTNNIAFDDGIGINHIRDERIAAGLTTLPDIKGQMALGSYRE